MAPCFIGLYKVEKIISATAVRLTLPQNMCIHPTFHVSQIKPVERSDLCPPPTKPPSPIMMDNQPAYIVKDILDARQRGRGFRFLVDWEGQRTDHESLAHSS